jgi:hypothetical protein
MRTTDRCILCVSVALACATPALAGSTGAAPPQLTGTYVALVPNYPSIGWYKGRYRLVIGPGRSFAVRSIPGVGTILYRAEYTRTRVTLPAGSGCATAGTYRWSLAGRQLVFEDAGDPGER